MRPLILAITAAALAAAACNESPTSPTPAAAVFRISACDGQSFNVRLTDPSLVRQARGLIGQADQPIVNGRLARGSGGFNEPWSWHLVPESIQFADVTVEVCDGCPQMVEDDLEYWLETVQRFCPWTSRVEERVQ